MSKLTCTDCINIADFAGNYTECVLLHSFVDNCSDTISRKQAIDALEFDYAYAAAKIIKALPPSPSRPKGRWIPCTKNGLPLSEMAYREGQKWYGYKCSNCNFIYKGNALTESPYCQKCGADMRP